MTANTRDTSEQGSDSSPLRGPEGRDETRGSSPSGPKGRMRGGAEGASTPEASPSYFTRPSLDDMGPGTDLPTPNRPSLFRKNTLDEMTVRRTEKPADDARPIRREKVGLGSYEDPATEKRRKRRPSKTGRPGR